MRAGGIKTYYLLLSLLSVVVLAQSYFIYDLKQTNKVEQNKTLKQASDKLSRGVGARDFFSTIQNDNTNPFEQMKKIQEEIQRSFGHFNSIFSNDPFFKEAYRGFASYPLSDIKEDKNRYIIELNIPGADDQNLEVKSEQNRVTIKATIHRNSDINGTNYIQREIYTQRFERSFILPKDADMDKIKNSYKNGILKITVPKKK